jgi:serine/threonine protein kinase
VVRVLDLGLARLQKTDSVVTSLTTLTAEGAVLGTVDYMAPEQAENTHAADARSDIYSLGCTLYFLLTGRAPFGGETLLERIVAHRDAPAPKLVEARPGVPSSLVALFERSLAKRPADRFATMTAFLEAAENCVAAGG